MGVFTALEALLFIGALIAATLLGTGWWLPAVAIAAILVFEITAVEPFRSRERLLRARRRRGECVACGRTGVAPALECAECYARNGRDR